MANRFLAVSLLVVTLDGCATQLHQRDQLACSGYGFQPGTEAFANCMMQRDLVRRDMWARRAATDALTNQAFWGQVGASR